MRSTVLNGRIDPHSIRCPFPSRQSVRSPKAYLGPRYSKNPKAQPKGSASAHRKATTKRKFFELTQEIVLQANKDAENAEVKKAAQKDSHKVWAKCVINPNDVDAEKAKKDLEESFKANNGWAP